MPKIDPLISLKFLLQYFYDLKINTIRKGMFKRVIASIILATLSSFAQSVEYDANRFKLYHADLNEDGTKDIYFHHADQFVPIYSDILIPIFLEGSYSQAIYSSSKIYWTKSPGAPQTGESSGRRERMILEQLQPVDARLSGEKLRNFEKLDEGIKAFAGDYNSDGLSDVMVFIEQSNYLQSQNTAGIYTFYGSINDTFDFDHSTDFIEGVGDYLSGRFSLGDSEGKVFVLYDGFDGYDGFKGKGPDVAETKYFIFEGNSLTQISPLFPGSEFTGRIDRLFVADTDGDGFDEIVFDDPNNPDYRVYSVKNRKEVTSIARDITFPTLNGASSGSFSVSETGSATYDMSLSLPQGTAGVAPELGISYNSSGGDGLLGKGFSLVGSESISRCPRSLVLDGMAEGVNYDENDAYCINGARLLRVESEGGYRQYELAVGYSGRFFSYGPAENPSYFAQETSDGTIRYFGNSSNSKLSLGSGVTISWNLNNVSDSIGNHIVYSYESDGLDNHRLTQIDYAFGTGQSANAQVKIDYEQRSDHAVSYLRGESITRSLRVDNIKVYNAEKSIGSGLKEVRSYQIGYWPGEGQSGPKTTKLRFVQECVKGACLPPTEFDWTRAVDENSFAEPVSTEIIQKKSRLLQSVVFDVDGDGVLEIAYIESDENHYEYIPILEYLVFDEATQSFEPGVFRDNNSIRYGDTKCGDFSQADHFDESKVREPFCDKSRHKSGIYNGVTLNPLDYNLDGRQDLILYRKKRREWLVYPSTPDSTGRWLLDGNPIVIDELKLPDGQVPANIIFTDLNGDGVADAIGDTHMWILEKDDSANLERQLKFSSPISYDISWEIERQEFEPYRRSWLSARKISRLGLSIAGTGDFDGDGSADLVLTDRLITELGPNNFSVKGDSERVVRQEHYYVAYATSANSFVVKRFLSSALSTDKELLKGHETDDKVSLALPTLASFQPVDINADGLTDLLETTYINHHHNVDTERFMLINTGNGFSRTPNILSGSPRRLSVSLIDYNQDGYPDLVWNDNDRKAMYVKYWNNAAQSFDGEFKLLITRDAPEDRHMFYDVNGDGGLDRVSFKDRKVEVRINEHERFDNLVKTITNGLGAQTEIQYELLSSSPNYQSSFEKAFGVDYVPSVSYQNNTAIINRASQVRTSQSISSQAGALQKPSPSGQKLTPAGVRSNYFNISYFYETIANVFEEGDQTLINQLNVPVQEYRAPVPIVASIKSSAPSGHLNSHGQVDKESSASIEYFYEHARYQGAGIGALGFAAVTSIDLQSGIKTTTQYRQDWPYIGRPIETTVTLQSGLFDETVISSKQSDWALQGFSDFKSRLINSDQGASILGPIKPILASSVDSAYSINNESSGSAELQDIAIKTQEVIVTTEYDNYLNATKVSTDTFGFTSAGAWERLLTTVVENDFDGDENYATQGEGALYSLHGSGGTGRATPAISSARLARLTNTKTVSQRLGKPARSEEASFTYFASGRWAGMIQQEVQNAVSDAPVYMSYEYDSFGNQSKITTSAQDLIYSPQMEVVSSAYAERFKEISYDSSGRYAEKTERVSAAGARFVEKEIIARNWLGLPTEVASDTADALQVTKRYDVLGRETYTADNVDKVDNVGNWTSTEYLQCNEVQGCPKGTSYAVKKTSATGGVNISYYDTLARMTRTATKAFDGAYVYVDTEFDKSGRTLRQSEPYYAGGAADYWTKNTYDRLGRVVRVDLPRENGVDTYQYLDNKVIQTNSLGQNKTTTKNYLGELSLVQDNNGGRITYEYTAKGELESVTFHPTESDKQNIVTSFEYDDFGRKIAMSDPDKGHWIYRYNGFGELVMQRDAKRQVTVNSYDNFGRLLRKRIASPDTSSGVLVVDHDLYNYYDGATDQNASIQPSLNAVFKRSASVLAYESFDGKCSSSAAVQCSYPVYDSFGRSIEHTVVSKADGVMETYSTGTDYDAFGRVSVQRDALHNVLKNRSGKSLKSGLEYRYNRYGYQEKVIDLESRTVLHQVLAMNARGQVTEEQTGNGVQSTTQYYEGSGLIKRQEATSSALFRLQGISYEWDALGNLLRRTNNSFQNANAKYRNAQDNFCYDNLNRLEKSYGGPSRTCASASTDYRYDSLGNLLAKNSEQNNVYGHKVNNLIVQPHALRANSRSTFEYDANGNMTQELQNGSGFVARFLDYTSDDRLSVVNKAGHTTFFDYGIDRSRFVRIDQKSNGYKKVTRYLGGIEKTISSDKSGQIEWKRYLGKTAIFTFRSDSQKKLLSSNAITRRYTFHDHLGSLDVITDDTGLPLHGARFDAWGARVEVNNGQSIGSSSLASLLAETNRGFTQHEMLDEVGLIHMNGRVYDPSLGRFLQADPFVQAPTETQNLNRYSYAVNNPLNAIDPSGFIHWNYLKKKYLKQAIAVVVTVVAFVACGPACSAGSWKAFAVGAATGLFGAYINGARGSSLFKAAVAGGIGGSLGGGFGGELYARTVTSAVVGGITSVISGGKFGHGFVAAGLSAGVTGKVGALTKVQSVALGAVLGGTASRISGGKFANGAITGAFAAAVREGARAIKKQRKLGKINLSNVSKKDLVVVEAAHKGGYDPNDPNYHRYDVESAICQTDSVCTMDSVALANRMHPAPGMFSNTEPVVNGQISNAQVGYRGELDDFGPVVHTVSSDGLTVRNTTLDGHKLFPGFVERTVFQRGNTIYIRTFGEGIGPMGAVNEFFAKPLWNGLVDSHVRYRVNLGYRN